MVNTCNLQMWHNETNLKNTDISFNHMIKKCKYSEIPNSALLSALSLPPLWKGPGVWWVSEAASASPRAPALSQAVGSKWWGRSGSVVPLPLADSPPMLSHPSVHPVLWNHTTREWKFMFWFKPLLLVLHQYSILKCQLYYSSIEF